MADNNRQMGTDKTTSPKFPTEKFSEKVSGQQPQRQAGREDEQPRTRDAQPHVPPDVQGQKRAANPTPSQARQTREDDMQSSDDLDKH